MSDSVVLEALERSRAGVMLAHLLSRAPDAVSPEVRRAGDDLLRRAAALEAIGARRLAAVAARFAAHGVPVLLMKGAALSLTSYPAPHLRPRHDDDLLVDPARFANACALLEAAGYVAEPQVAAPQITGQRHFSRTDPQGTHHVDLHWRPVNPTAFADLPAFGELQQASVPLPGHDWLRGLGPEHALLLACVHRVAHHTPTEDPQWLLDIHLLGSGLAEERWEGFVVLALRARQAALCASELARAKEVFDTPVPDAVLQDLGRARGEPSEAHLAAHDPLRVQWLNLRYTGGWRARVNLVRQHLFPPAAYMRARYGVTSTPRLLWCYAHRAAAGLARWVREALARTA